MSIEGTSGASAELGSAPVRPARAVSRLSFGLATLVLFAVVGAATQPGTGPADDISPKALEWAIKFASMFEICPPLPPAPCFSPRPGHTTVVLDYATGKWA